jgi:hypothetical protein
MGRARSRYDITTKAQRHKENRDNVNHLKMIENYPFVSLCLCGLMKLAPRKSIFKVAIAIIPREIRQFA